MKRLIIIALCAAVLCAGGAWLYLNFAYEPEEDVPAQAPTVAPAQERLAPFDEAVTLRVLTEDGVVELTLREYLVGVLLAEMPADFPTEALKAQFKPQSEKQVKVRLALEKIAELENLEPTEEEVEAEFEKLAKTYEMEVDKIKNIVAEAQVKADLKNQKAVDFVKANAVVKTEE